ncbi:hypothetical protein KIN20_012627 [Parelaphostrongylus tenuis]|uniref:Uncharacterized protein n=1 Tax=Parelaphostrongylus tenuis TaxID=148309 RepID=A0AAD5N191_PARTN|nr:hypothetical protein KIN20_012627 [Parelaphostrongylus tenuis]
MRLLLEIAVVLEVAVEALPQDLLSVITEISEYSSDDMDMLVNLYLKGYGNEESLKNRPLHLKNIDFQCKNAKLTSEGKEFIKQLFYNYGLVSRKIKHEDMAWKTLRMKMRGMPLNDCNTLQRVFPALNQFGNCSMKPTSAETTISTMPMTTIQMRIQGSV